MASTVLITGGAGFIGSHLADELLSAGYRVRALDSLVPQVHGDERVRPKYLANDVELFTGYRHELRKHGIFELPLNLKRSHFSYAHTDADVDRLLEATEAAVTTVLARR